MNWASFLFSFHGRINRAKYWLAGFLYIAVWIAFFIVSLMLLGNSIDDLLSFAGASALLWLVGAVLFVATMWSGLATGIKRLHDRDKSGWWILLFYFAPSVLSSWQVTAPTSGSATILGFAGFAISVWSFIELGCLRGTSGVNAYGPDPLGGFSNEPLR